MRNAVLLGILTAAMMFAQGRGIGGGGGDEMGGGGGGGGRDMGGGGMQPRRATKAELFADKLKLTREQREETQKILSAAMERTLAIRTDMEMKRANLAGSIIDGKTEDQKKAATEYAAASAQLTKIEAEAFGKIWATLKPNQQGKGAEAFELMTGLFHLAPRPGGRGPGGGGMGRGRGGAR